MRRLALALAAGGMLAISPATAFAASPSRAAVIQASGRLGIPYERLMDSAWLGPGLPFQEDAPRCSPPCGRRAWPRGYAN
jgi:hypothetical protein